MATTATPSNVEPQVVVAPRAATGRPEDALVPVWPTVKAVSSRGSLLSLELQALSEAPVIHIVNSGLQYHGRHGYNGRPGADGSPGLNGQGLGASGGAGGSGSHGEPGTAGSNGQPSANVIISLGGGPDELMFRVNNSNPPERAKVGSAHPTPLRAHHTATCAAILSTASPLLPLPLRPPRSSVCTAVGVMLQLTDHSFVLIDAVGGRGGDGGHGGPGGHGAPGGCGQPGQHGAHGGPGQDGTNGQRLPSIHFSTPDPVLSIHYHTHSSALSVPLCLCVLHCLA